MITGLKTDITLLSFLCFRVSKSVYLPVLFIIYSFSIFAQAIPNPIAITTEDGLVFRNVRTLIQDSRGLIWIGTQKGVQRFDGVNFRTFSSDKKADIHFPGDDVIVDGLLFFNESTLWVVANLRLFAIDMCTYEWNEIGDAIIPDALFMGLYNSKDGNIIILAAACDQISLLYYNRQTDKINLVANSKESKSQLHCVVTDTSGNIWWSTANEEVRQFKPDGSLLKSVRPDSFYWYGQKSYYHNLFIDSDNQMYLFLRSKNQICKYNPEKNTKEIIIDSMQAPTYLGFEDEKKIKWFATNRGLFKYDDKHGKHPEITDLEPYLQSTLNFTNISGLFEDNQNMLWLATNNGIIKLPNRKKQFNSYLTISGSSWGNEMRGIFQAKNGMMYSYCENGDKGLHEINPLTGQSRLVYPFGSNVDGILKMEHTKNMVMDFQNNSVWALTDKLYRIDLNTLKGEDFKIRDGVSDKFGHNPIAILKNGNLIYGYRLENIYQFNPKTREHKLYLKQINPGYNEIRNECLVEDKNRNIWIGTKNGIYVVNPEGEIILKLNKKTSNSLSSEHVLCMLFDRNDDLWVGTFGGGLNKITFDWIGDQLNPQHIPIRNIKHLDGICNENVTAILQDDLGKIWASTYKGLACYDPVVDVFFNYYVEEGLSHNEFNYTSAYKDEKGFLWFGGMNGINVVNPHEQFEYKQSPALAFSSFSRYNRAQNKFEEVLINDGYHNEAFIISPYDSWFQFSWALPDYYKSDKNTYSIMVGGRDNKWIYNGNLTSVRFNSLPKGDYFLHVKSSELQSKFTAGMLSIPFTVLPIFYETWWFRISVLLFISSIVYIVFQYMLKRRLEIERMRTQIASDLHDEVGSMLSGLAMQSELLKLNEVQHNEKRLENISSLSRSAVQKMRDMVWSIDNRRDSVKNLIEKMQEQAGDLLQPKEISYKMQIGELPMGKHMNVIDRQQLFLIYKEALTNIVKHSNADEVFISIGNNHDKFRMIIKDNGRNSVKEYKGTGMGISNMQMRAKKINADILIENNNGYTITLQMKKL